MKQITVSIFGRVQGVGYRYFVLNAVRRTAIKGYVQNQRNGSVLVVAEGNKKQLDILIEELTIGPSSGRVDRCCVQWASSEGVFDDFQVKA